jgi:hypothetical protein
MGVEGEEEEPYQEAVRDAGSNSIQGTVCWVGPEIGCTGGGNVGG